MLRHFNKPRFIPLIMSVGGVALMFGLGIWQLQRLEWKETIIATIEKANASEPLTELPHKAVDIKEKQFYRVVLQGVYYSVPEFHLAARYYRSQLGYSVLTPFELTDGRIVLVNRGWIPAKAKPKAEYLPPPPDEMTIIAMIRTSDERNPFTPESQPEKNIWFGRDVALMGKAAAMEFEPLTLDLIAENAPTDVLPIATGGAIELRNDHLSYAVTWFSIGLGILVISLLYHRKKPA